VEEGIEGAAAGTTCGSQTKANTAPSTSRSRRRPWASSASQRLLAPFRRSTRSRGRPGVRQQWWSCSCAWARTAKQQIPS